MCWAGPEAHIISNCISPKRIQGAGFPHPPRRGASWHKSARPGRADRHLLSCRLSSF